MLQAAKQSLRISHSKSDTDIQDTINACKADLERAGISVNEEDPLIIQAVKLFCRWFYNFENQADRYRRSYDSLVTSMSLDGERRAPDV